MFPSTATMRRLSQLKAISVAGCYFRQSKSVLRGGMILLGWQIRQQGRNSCSVCCSLLPAPCCHCTYVGTLHPLLLLFQLATVEPGMKFHMYTKEELEEVIKDI